MSKWNSVKPQNVNGQSTMQYLYSSTPSSLQLVCSMQVNPWYRKVKSTTVGMLGARRIRKCRLMTPFPSSQAWWTYAHTVYVQVQGYWICINMQYYCTRYLVLVPGTGGTRTTFQVRIRTSSTDVRGPSKMSISTWGWKKYTGTVTGTSILV